MQTSKPATPAHPAPGWAVTKRKPCDTQKIHRLAHLPSLDGKPTKGYFLVVLVSIGLALAFGVVMADKVTLKTPAFELHTEKSK